MSSVVVTILPVAPPESLVSFQPSGCSFSRFARHHVTRAVLKTQPRGKCSISRFEDLTKDFISCIFMFMLG